MSIQENRLMAGFLPFAGKNSIVEAVFGLQFAQLLNPVIGSTFDALQSEFIADFPKFEKMQMLQLTLGIPQQHETATSMVGGFNASRFRADGKPARAFRGVNNTLSVHFFEYDHWEETKAAAFKFFSRCFSVLNIPSSQYPITAVVLRFVDRFTYDGRAEDASAGQLLSSDTRYVPRAIFDVANPWHVNLGWTSRLVGRKDAQHQLNVQGAKDANSFVMIHHNIQCNLFPFLANREATGVQSLEGIFDAQHAENVSLLRNMLSEKMLDDIGLGGKKS